MIQATEASFNGLRPEREAILEQKIQEARNDLAARNMSSSSPAAHAIIKLYADELKARCGAAWDSMKKLFEKQGILFSEEHAQGIKDKINDLIKSETKMLSGLAQATLERMRLENHRGEAAQKLALARSASISRIDAEFNIYIASEHVSGVAIRAVTERAYIDEGRIKELRAIHSEEFSLVRLIRLCEEINVSHRYGSNMSVIMAVRAVMDHVPPVFELSTFSEVANNYKGSRSFKESMSHLDRSSRNIANSYLHTQIRRKEALPTDTQVDFSRDLDVLLQEIVRILK